MTTSAFSVSQGKYSPKAGDYFVIPYLDGAISALDEKRVVLSDKAILDSKNVPQEKGALQLAAVTSSGKSRFAVAICRLDKPALSLARQVKIMIANALKEAEKLGLKQVVTSFDKTHEALCLAVQEGALLGGYVYDAYLSKKKKPASVRLVTGLGATHFTTGKHIAGCVQFARDTLNAPPAQIHPVSLAKAYATEGKKHGLTVTVWDEKRLQKEKCGGILAVGQGSASKPRMVCATYGSKRAKRHLALVGKGVTFDSGGYSLKPSKSMTEMKFDMGGAAMMFGAACAIAKLKLPIRLSVYLPLAHNAISAQAYNVSDIVKTRSGKTIEVLNTDAEGRIILADALTVAQEQNPDVIIDAATLTGAAVVALGEDIAAVYGDDGHLVSQLLDAGKAVGENLWPMPLHEGYDEQLDSKIADVKNIGGGWGGSITAALFLKRFVSQSEKWIHLDIAGPGCKLDALEHLGAGAKGFGIKSVVALASAICK